MKTKQFLVAFASFIIFDFIWLGFVMKDFNMRQLAEVGRIENGVLQMHVVPAAITYVLMAFAVSFYVLPRLSDKKSHLIAFLNGAPLGLVIYGVFDMTNLAILKNYPPAFVLPDIAWGTFVFGLVSAITAAVSGSRGEIEGS